MFSINKIFLTILLSIGLLSCSTNTTNSKTVTKTETTPKKNIEKVISDTTSSKNSAKITEESNAVKLKNYKITNNYYPAKGQDERIRYLILHYTAMDNAPSIKTLSQKDVSAHYLVNDKDDDSIYLLVNENKRAWHAGVSYWKGVNNLNFSSLGIEIVNNGYKKDTAVQGGFKFIPFPDFQVKKIAELCVSIINRYNIDPTYVLGHSDIAPGRKQDPGPYFPWKQLYDEYGIGAWYNEDDRINFINQYPYEKINDKTFIMQIQKDLSSYGYEIEQTGIWDSQTKNVLTVFQYHFRPSYFDGYIDAETWAILKSLIKKYRS